MIHTRIYQSPLGQMLLAEEENALVGAWFIGQKHFPATLPLQNSELPVLLQAEQWLDCYFSGQQPDFLPPLNPKGTDFQRSVWKLLLDIPYGKTTTYGALLPGSARAVGSAVGRNPISLFIPCHRVVRSDHKPSGYAGGTERKNFLIQLEREQP